MLNNIIKSENRAAVLTVVGCYAYHESFENAADASERLIRSAELLPENEFLGWQINADEEGDRHVFAFAGSRAAVTQEDFGWIFQRCASVGGVSQDPSQALWSGNRRIYALRYLPENRDSRPDHRNDVGMKRYYKDLLEQIDRFGAGIRIAAGAGCGGIGMILISLPDEMTLRMRTVLSMAFQDTVAAEIGAPEDAPEDVSHIPSEYLTDIMTGLLGGLMLEQAKKEREEAEKAEEEEEEDMSALMEKDGTHIDTLDLSVRAYNCLMRTGIRTVEELRALTDDDLSHIRNLGRKCTEEIKRKLAGTENSSSSVPLTAPSYSAMLDELIGLKNVKEQVRKITALAKMKQDMVRLGKDPVSVVLNMEFVGNPGTAKTTVARLMAGIFHEIGLLASREPVEVGRADLVARYVGHTADNVRSVFRRAKGKLLFIDEAYSLVEGGAGQFGDEAINTIVQEMENNREDTIVIFAGYPDKMEEFFSRNPGLRSRVPLHISFSDYSADEMVQIAESEAKRRGFSIHPDARGKVASVCAAAVHDPDMGNGRFCRNLVESAILSYASRVYGNDDASFDKDFVLTDADFVFPGILREAKKTAPIGFAA